MKDRLQVFLLGIVLLLVAFCGPVAASDSTMAFTVSMEKPHTHYYQVVFHCRGMIGETQDFKLPVWTPGWNGGLSARDEILTLDGKKATSRSLQNILGSKKPGDKLQIVVSRRGQRHKIDVILTTHLERSFRIKPHPNPDPLQSRILDDWLRGK
jgi:predicted metalloprotease with PDZ domain